nr:ornithine cyclodeaminase family protein [Corynebacterium sp. UBA5992]
MSRNIPFISAAQVFARLSPATAVEIIRRTLATGYEPSTNPPRQAVPIPHGQLLTMPSSTDTGTGIKVLTIAEQSLGEGIPRIQGQYLLFDGATLSPRAIIDGAALTTLRTPALSLAGISQLLEEEDTALPTVIFGTGPQARGHAEALSSFINGRRDIDITFISRSPAVDLDNWQKAGSDKARTALAQAELVMCCTTSAEPLFSLPEARQDSIIVAMGSHEPHKRELGSDVMGSAQVIVEDTANALRECGDVILAIEEGSLEAGSLIEFKDIVTGRHSLNRESPVVFKTSGMGWQDLVLAQAIAAAAEKTPPEEPEGS